MVPTANKVTKATLLALGLALAPYALAGWHVTVQRVEISNLGIYEVAIVGKVDDPYLLGGIRNIVRQVRRIGSTPIIPARRCVTFGFEYFILGAPSGADVPIKMVTRFPAQGLRDPETGKTTDRNETLLGRTVGKRHFRAYTLEKSWEIVLGTWTCELWHGDRKLAEQSFKLVDPCPERCEGRMTSDELACEKGLISFAPAPSPGEEV